MVELLARGLRERDGGAEAPFTVAELRRSLLPYPRCREALGLASKAEYDVALLRLLHEGGIVEADDPGLEEDVERELASPEPGLGLLDDYAAAALEPGDRLRRRLADAGAGSAGGGSAAGPDGPDVSGPGPDGGAAGVEDSGGAAGTRPGEGADRGDGGDDGGVPLVSRQSDREAPSGACASCGGALPDVEGLRYCPRCGAALGPSRCGTCGEELEDGWRYCPFCGSERHG